MSKVLAVAILLMAFALNGAAQNAPSPAPKPAPVAKKKPPKPAKPADTVQLSGIVEAVELVVDAYNTRPETQGANPTLPPLKTADFDFKTVVDLKGGVSVNFLIFKFGATHEKAVTNDVTFTYAPQPVKGLHADLVQGQNLKDELTKAIDGAVNQIKGEQSDDKSPLKFQLKTLAVTLAFAVTGDYSGGLTIPIHMVTLGGTGDISNSSTQTVKLTFSFPDKP
jgi:hypothetical protein